VIVVKRYTCSARTVTHGHDQIDILRSLLRIQEFEMFYLIRWRHPRVRENLTDCYKHTHIVTEVTGHTQPGNQTSSANIDEVVEAWGRETL